MFNDMWYIQGIEGCDLCLEWVGKWQWHWNFLYKHISRWMVELFHAYTVTPVSTEQWINRNHVSIELRVAELGKRIFATVKPRFTFASYIGWDVFRFVPDQPLGWIFVVCRSTRTYYPDSEPTSLCSYSLMRPSREATDTNFIVFGLIRPGLKSMICHTRGEHDAVLIGLTYILFIYNISTSIISSIFG